MAFLLVVVQNEFSNISVPAGVQKLGFDYCKKKLESTLTFFIFFVYTTVYRPTRRANMDYLNV